MSNSKAALEKIEPIFGSSFTLRRFTETQNQPFWHCHPEYEIVFISNGKGKRHIGDHISYYEDGDLIFLGPDLPHFSFTQGLNEEHVEIVVQMKGDFLGAEFLKRPEMQAIQQLFERSKQGLTFRGETKRYIGRLLEDMMPLNGFDRLMALLRTLNLMATSDEYEMLNVSGYALEVNAQDHDRMKTIYEYVEAFFRDEVNLDEAARRINMTTPAFCRYFKRLTAKTFTQFVNEFRVAHACRLLFDEHISIAGVSYESGFNNLSHFNKQFREITGVSPREYRKSRMMIVN